MSLWISTTRPTSAAKSSIRSRAGSCRLATPPATLRRHELLMDRELANAGEDARETSPTSAECDRRHTCLWD